MEHWNMTSIGISVSIGEAYDRLSILAVKSGKIKDGEKKALIHSQYSTLESEIKAFLDTYPDIEIHIGKIANLFTKLVEINLRLWDIEDNVRECEAKQDFGLKFIENARSVYHINDERHARKLEIDKILGSSLQEQKEYVKYEKDNSISESI